MKKNVIGIIFVFVFLTFFLSGCSNKGITSVDSHQKPVIGIVIGTFADTWRTNVRNAIYKYAEEQNVQVNIWTGNNSQDSQNEKIALLLQKKVNALVVNLVDPAGAGVVIESARKAGVPVIFFNREPQLTDLQKWDKAYYVGAKAEQSGTLEGQLLVQYFKSHPVQNGVIRYVMIKGEPGHQDAEARTKYAIQSLENAGFKVKKIAEEAAMWDRMKSQTIMESVLASQDGNIDCVIANNDDMALGAIDALKMKGYFQNGKYMPVVGVDATSSAIKALEEGALLGTVLNDAATQGQAIFNLSNVLAQGQIPDSNNCGFNVTDGKYIWVDYKTITKQNISDAK